MPLSQEEAVRLATNVTCGLSMAGSLSTVLAYYLFSKLKKKVSQPFFFSCSLDLSSLPLYGPRILSLFVSLKLI